MIAVVTGAAGFIGSRLCRRLLDNEDEVVGVDSFSPYYSPEWKRQNVADLLKTGGFRLAELDLARGEINELVNRCDVVFHLAAQAGVRASWGEGFRNYVKDNVEATQRLLEACIAARVPRLVFASSSSVYGDAETFPTREEALPQPISPYGVTKLAGEHLVRAYAANFDLAVTILRYFTVYGPGQRPDMGFHRFIVAALTDGEIDVFGDGEQTRDVTYVDDVVSATVSAGVSAPAIGQTINVGGGSRVSVNEVLDTIGQVTGKSLKINRGKPQPGDVRNTGAELSRAGELLGYRPSVGIREGLANQASWVRKRLGTDSINGER